jgi:uncharacterized protein (DUF2252 family)
MAKVYKRIKRFNGDRAPELVQLKYRKMRDSILKFYRGSCHLFYQDLPDKSFIRKSPPAWICGDLHLENFGSYKADNRLVYFDINDFDESALAPCLLDVARLTTGILIAADSLQIDGSEALALCETYLQRYAQTLGQGHARLVEKESAEGATKHFLENRHRRNREDFIASHTEVDGGKLILRPDKHILKVDKCLQKRLSTAIEKWSQRQDDPGFYQVLDVGLRLAGTGSLGLERYVLLVAGKGKVASRSCLVSYLDVKQPKWPNDAERIVAIQRRMQAFPRALLGCVPFDGKWFVLKELQPEEDKMDLSVFEGESQALGNVLCTLADVTAWDHLRGSGRSGSATTDDLIEYAHAFTKWKKPLLGYCRDYAQQVLDDYQAYSAAYDEGYFERH